MGYVQPWLYTKQSGSNQDIIGIGALRLYGLAGTTPRLDIVSGDYVYLYTEAAKGFWLVDPVGSSFLTINWVTPDVQLTTFTNYNLALLPNGTGKVKFGTYSASGDVACNGSIAILDAAGNARKLMTTA